MAKVHIGKKIKEVVKQLRFPITEFAAEINKSRTVAYDIFEREAIDTDLLMKISEVLKHDFFSYYALSSFAKEEKIKYLTQVELLTVLSEEIRTLRKQISNLEKKYGGLEKGKSEKNKSPYIKKRSKK